MAYARTHRAMGSTDLPSGRYRPPISPLRVGVHGGWLEIRATPSDGACGVSGYPCKHPGVDVAGAAGTPVVAPEGGTVVAVSDGTAAPFDGYGPWLVVIAGRDSGKHHLLAHLAPATAYLAPMNAEVEAGQMIGTTSAANHTHWEVRDKAVPDFGRGESNFTNNTDPLAWLARVSGPGLGTVIIAAGLAAILLLLHGRRS